MITARRYARFAWGVVTFNLVVVLWGAFVRASGSGAGCGRHWPRCNGEVIPHSPALATMIEFGHRLSSGVSLILIAVLFAGALYCYPRRHRVRRGGAWSVGFILSEALIGAGLVLFALVARDQSVARVWSHAAHLVNTFLLLGALTLTAWWASGGEPVRLRGQGLVVVLLAIGVVGALLLGASGAITALGDTLFPSSSLAGGLAEDWSTSTPWLIRLRVFHPFLATGLGMYLVLAGRIIGRLRPGYWTRRFGQALLWLFAAQMVVGIANVGLLAPIPLQLVHLLLADLVWIALVLLGASALAVPAGHLTDVTLPQPSFGQAQRSL
ncbi:MAG: hypothetical protein NVS4B8_17220 [Herpetosiphon sp.]